MIDIGMDYELISKLNQAVFYKYNVGILALINKAIFFFFGSFTMSSSTSENRNLLQICNGCEDQMELLTLHITKNPNRKFWICRGCTKFQWAENRKPSEDKIDLLVEEVRKLALEIHCLSAKFQSLHKELEHMRECEVQRRFLDDELRRRQTPRYDFIKILVIVVLCFLFKYYL